MKKATHSYTHKRKTTMNMGEIVPIDCIECNPGDHVRFNTSMLMRTTPLATPAMHEVDVFTATFFVASRNVWDEFEEFYTRGLDGLDTPTPPTIESPSMTGWAVGSLSDHLGMPSAVPNMLSDAKQIRAYQQIVNNYFLDSQLQPQISVGLGGGVDTTTSRDLQFACWSRDRFTSCRTDPQLGTSVTIPLLGDAPIVFTEAGATPGVRTLQRAGNSASTALDVVQAGTGDALITANADLAAVSAFDVEDLREGSSFQRMKENLNTDGARYDERIKAGFGVPIRDSRIQIPEYLGGGFSRIQFSEVLQTTPNEEGEGVGDLYGHGITGHKSHHVNYMAPEHGYLITVCVVRPKPEYYQGLPKQFSRPTQLDYLQPELVNLGDQPVFNREVYAAHSDPGGVHGYLPIYDEFRHQPSTIHGELRSILKDWTEVREFSGDTALNGTFVRCNPSARIFQTTLTDQLICTVKHKMTCRSIVPKYPQRKLF